MSDRGLRIAMLLLAVAGIGVAGYLTIVHYSGSDPWCTALSDCTRVQDSAWATPLGVPVALIGLLAYVALLVTLLIPGETARLAGALIAFTGFGFSVYLTTVEAFRIEAWCQWCVVSAIIMTVLAVLAGVRVIRGAVVPAAALH